MDISEIFQKLFFEIDANFQEELFGFLTRLGWFILFTLIAILAARLLPAFFQWGVDRFAPKFLAEPHDRIITPLRNLMVRSGFLIFIAININLFRPYTAFFNFLQFFSYLSVTITLAWFLSRLVRQIIRVYGITLIQNLSREGDDILVAGETVANVIIGFLGAIFFAQSQDLNLVSVLTGFGIGGIAVAFAAKEVLSQIIGTVVLYLDRPYVPGEYIRANFNPVAEDIYGRVESIGIRSTKVRLVVTNTLLIVPNSIMASTDVENVSRGKKVMALLYLDFPQVLASSERALVEQTLQDSLGGLFGVEQGSVRIATFEPEDKPGTRARVSFFLLSSSSTSLNIRKRLVEMANQEIAQRLQKNQLQFSMEEPMIYVDSPITK
ncbi:mechanosensitive ion channel family protein [Dactylococcopsis salina]|uniref:Small-conductance mechanosensitive channel n=1 Tax=Dactylococcopsis salina (strain PCC 8305) TaxID=13035 RepID=K9YX37_DACS8|nr:mechanosensitive ion channel domain-containing protein [Dactylococcopsis salina]AFZ50885.1 small-conductance mechanosensitive channel [Dactylococcopsis salina PCC 8305]